MYHPHTANTASMEEIQRNIRLASSNDKHTVWIGGDFNLPEINWEDLDNIASSLSKVFLIATKTPP
jgi:hypothetical protein